MVGRSQLGLTLIELMISIAIGLVVVGAVTYLYVGSRGAYRGNEGLARIQEAGRFAIDSITRDIRRSGALGCGSRLSASNGLAIQVKMVGVPLVAGAANAIQGFAPASYTPLPATAAPAGWTPPTAYWGGDVLQLQIASGTPVRVTVGPDPINGTVTIADNSLPNSAAANFAAGDYAVVASCTAATVFKVTTGPGPTVPAILNFTPSGLMSGFPVTGYPTLQHFDQVTYYVGKVPNSASANVLSGLSALYRYSANSGQAEELVENIEDMDVVYGIAPAGATSATLFEHASLMTAADWPNVVSVRVSLLAVGDQLGVAPPALPIPFRTDPTASNATALVPVTASDTRLRQVFTATAALRDRLL